VCFHWDRAGVLCQSLQEMYLQSEYGSMCVHIAIWCFAWWGNITYCVECCTDHSIFPQRVPLMPLNKCGLLDAVNRNTDTCTVASSRVSGPLPPPMVWVEWNRKVRSSTAKWGTMGPIGSWGCGAPGAGSWGPWGGGPASTPGRGGGINHQSLGVTHLQGGGQRDEKSLSFLRFCVFFLVFRSRSLQNRPGTCLNASGVFFASNLHM